MSTEDIKQVRATCHTLSDHDLTALVMLLIGDLRSNTIDTERERGAAILRDAKAHAIKCGDYPLGAALRDVLDAIEMRDGDKSAHPPGQSEVDR